MVRAVTTRPAFLWIGNHPATDLCNTEPVVDGERVELLADLDAVAAWARLAGIATTVDPDEIRGRERVTTLDFVLRLRASLRSVLDPAPAGGSSVRALNEILDDQPGALRVDLSAPEPVSLTAPRPGAQVRLDIANAVLDIFHYDRSLVRRCANPACILLFLDISKSGRRRWCDMATCGNRAKAAGHYARAHGGGSTGRRDRAD